jgi:GrpB-like predicted nucleotidyltransferase (UPF0157 family)
MSERVCFRESLSEDTKVAALYRQVEGRLLALVPRAVIEHVGSTSLPDLLTKGDLDVQVRVAPEDFTAACRALAGVYQDNPGGFTDQGHSFKDDATDPPLGIHVTIVNGPSDVQFRHRDLLRANADLRAEYNALKRRFDGGEMNAYREAKEAFFRQMNELQAR